MSAFLDSVKKRRSIYSLTERMPFSDEKLEKMIKTAVNYTPSAYNSQSSRVVLLLGEDHKKLWSIVLETLRPMVPPDKFGRTEDKIATFAAGHGTILFYEDQATVKKMQEENPGYKDNFPKWSLQSGGMLQFVIWTMLSDEGVGASLQHYNPLIDEEVATKWNIPKEWSLLAQMPFGMKAEEADEKTFIEIEKRFKVFGGE